MKHACWECSKVRTFITLVHEFQVWLDRNTLQLITKTHACQDDQSILHPQCKRAAGESSIMLMACMSGAFKVLWSCSVR
jgi:hypothetical protein